MNREYETHEHEFPPVYDNNSTILIMGSFPSVKSREEGFYYGHPQNRFWKVISSIYDENIPITIDEKKELLLKHNIALWDVISKCDIVGSSDSSIKNIEVNDIKKLIAHTHISKLYANGKKAWQLYMKYVYDDTKTEAYLLPSTSPANAAWTLDKLVTKWHCAIVTNSSD